MHPCVFRVCWALCKSHLLAGCGSMIVTCHKGQQLLLCCLQYSAASLTILHVVSTCVVLLMWLVWARTWESLGSKA